jgi:hypothetical protein
MSNESAIVSDHASGDTVMKGILMMLTTFATVHRFRRSSRYDTATCKSSQDLRGHK